MKQETLKKGIELGKKIKSATENMVSITKDIDNIKEFLGEERGVYLCLREGDGREIYKDYVVNLGTTIANDTLRLYLKFKQETVSLLEDELKRLEAELENLQD